VKSNTVVVTVTNEVLAFIALIRIRGVNPFILVSASRASCIKPGWCKPPPVLVRVNGEPENAWRIKMMPAGDRSFCLYLHGDIRKASGAAAGDRIRVEIDFDASYRNGAQHARSFTQALAENPQAKKNWMAPIPSRKKEILRYFSRLHSSDARSRNLSKALHVLSGGAGRFMARAWKNCRKTSSCRNRPSHAGRYAKTGPGAGLVNSGSESWIRLLLEIVPEKGFSLAHAVAVLAVRGEVRFFIVGVTAV
jgi:hypothetical protein